MDRRSFFRTMVGGVAATAAVRTWPFRVFSFPSEVVVPTFYDLSKFATIYYNKEAIDALQKAMLFGSSTLRFNLDIPKTYGRQIRLSRAPSGLYAD